MFRDGEGTAWVVLTVVLLMPLIVGLLLGYAIGERRRRRLERELQMAKRLRGMREEPAGMPRDDSGMSAVLDELRSRGGKFGRDA